MSSKLIKFEGIFLGVDHHGIVTIRPDEGNYRKHVHIQNLTLEENGRVKVRFVGEYDGIRVKDHLGRKMVVLDEWVYEDNSYIF